MEKLKNNINGKDAIYDTELHISKIDNFLYFKFVSSHCSYNSYSNTYNDEIWRGDVCEVFIETNERSHYLEIEIAPNGTMFLADICNINQNRTHIHLKNKGITGSVEKDGDKLISIIGIDLSYFDIPENPGFNAYRIDTDNERSDKHLFALNPTMCGSFHHPEFFIKLKKYL